MAQSVVINGRTYNLPQPGDDPDWGEDLSAVISALIDVSSTVSGTGDINTTSFTIANNIGSATNVTGLSFDTSVVRGSKIEYSIYRSTNSTEVSECGTMYISYSSSAATWELSRVGVGDSGVAFTIATNGQIKYTSSNMSGSSYSGLLKFKASGFTQT